MIDLSSLKAPGWQRVVAELCAECGDDRAYLERLARVVGKVSAARQSAVHLPGGEGPADGPRALCVWPAPGPGGEERAAAVGEGSPVEFAKEALAAAGSALESGQSRAFGLGGASALYGQESPEGYILAVPLPGADGKPAAALTLLIEARAKTAVQSTLAMAEVLAGYVSGHAARQQLRRTQSAALAMDLATRLLAAMNGAPNFKGATLQLVNDLAKQFKAERVALGWVKRDTVKAVALSDTEHFDRRMAMVQQVESAMDECLDQEQPVVYPAPGEQADVLLAQAITQAHRALAASGHAPAGLRVCSAPLRDGERVVGVVLIEFGPGGVAGDGPSVDLDAVELLQATMDLVAPVLAVRRSDDRNLAVRAWDDLVKAGAWVVGPKHTVWKLVAVVLAAGLMFVSFYTTPYRVGAEATLQPRTRHVISVPFEGVIRSVPEGVEAGARVKRGDVLAQMEVTEWELTASEARQKIAQAQTDLRTARAEGKPGEADKAMAAEEIGRAALTNALEKIRLARITAPLDGTILAGRVQDRVGSSVKTGDRLFEIAPIAELIAVTRVDERDIGLVRVGTRGAVATRSRPDEPLEVEVETIVPLAQADEGKNLFEVRARLVEAPPGWARPGMEGIAKMETERRSLLYIGTRRIADAIRLWLW